MAAKKLPIIIVPRDNIMKLAKANGASRTAVYMALRYASHSDTAEKIRKEAVDFYGGVKTYKTVLV